MRFKVVLWYGPGLHARLSEHETLHSAVAALDYTADLMAVVGEKVDRQHDRLTDFPDRNLVLAIEEHIRD